MRAISSAVFFLAGVFAILFLAHPTATYAKTDEDLANDDRVVDSALLPSGRTITPAGKTLAFHGRPVDVVLSPDGRLLFVKDRKHLRIIDAASFELLQSLESEGGASLHGLAVDRTGTVYFTNAGNLIHVYQPNETIPAELPTYALSHSIELPKDSFPCGIALSTDDSTAYVCLSKSNQLAAVNLKTRQVVEQTKVGIAPFAVQLDEQGNRLFVTNMGGRWPTQDDKTAPSAGTETPVDKRGIANSGTVSVVDRQTMKAIGELPVGLQPSEMALLPESRRLVVANSNLDTLSIITPDLTDVGEFVLKPDAKLPFGSMPSALLLTADGNTMFAALAGNNAIAVLDCNDLNSGGRLMPEHVRGFVPTGWYPVAMECDESHLFVVNLKGTGSREILREEAKGRNSHDHQCLLQKIPLESVRSGDQLAEWTEAVKQNSRIPQIRNAMRLEAANPDPDQRRIMPVPIPKRLGEPSVFKHVIYVIKENRTFDQVFGDIEEARADDRLCVFPENVTPNHHALAKRCGILDNYYCNGVLSADGHSWATEGNVTPYLERAFGGFARSYTFGDDPITYSSSGFLWDHFLAAGLSFRNYGEMDYAGIPDDNGFKYVWAEYQAGRKTTFKQNIGVERLRRYSCRDYPGWNMNIPDVLRVDRFLEEVKEFEKNDGLPNLSIVYFPQDHLGGDVTSRAHMADNDLALGKLIEALSRSKYWQDTVVFVNEDDPQNGYDHIDGHRSICLAISAYSKPGVNHHFCNQTSVLRTILHIFGLPPMNQQDASAPLMSHCFQATPNLEPYVAIPANFALNEYPKPKNEQSGAERQWRATLATVPIERTGMKTEQDEDNLNRFVWHEMKGWEFPYPTKFAGAHGAGLDRYGLIHE